MIKKLYGLYDEVRAADIDLFFKNDIDTMLEQTLPDKKKWIVRWKAAIHSSRKRAKREGISNTKAIWKHFGSEKPTYKVKAEHVRRNTRHKKDLKQRRNAPVREITKGKGGFKIIGRKRSTNTCDSETHKPKRFKEDRPSVIDHFSKKRQKTADDPEDRFGDADND